MSDAEVESAQPAESDSEEDAEDIAEDPARLLYTSDDALTFEEARRITGRRGVTLVLLVGEVGAGKTTVLVETWWSFLTSGALGGHDLAGCRTALAFEERAYYSRVASGLDVPDTPRTSEESDGFLHLGIRRPDGARKDLLFADITGEHFERVREGEPLVEELPWVSRADRFLVMVDGKEFATPGEREEAINNSSRQLHALRVSRAFAPNARLAVLLVKADAMSDPILEEYNAVEERLLELARLVDTDATALRMAARPADGGKPRGLNEFIEFLCADDRPRAVHIPDRHQPARSIARFIR